MEQLKKLSKAVKNNKADEVRRLLEMKDGLLLLNSDIDDKSNTILHRACIESTPEIVKMLLDDERVSVNSMNDDYDTPLFYLVKNLERESKPIKSWLTGRPDNSKLLKRKNQIDIIDLFLQHKPGEKEDVKDENVKMSRIVDMIRNNKTPLTIAIFNSELELVSKFLASEKFDVNLSNLSTPPFGTPLHHAIYTLNPECVKLLLDNEKIDINKKDSSENTPLELLHRIYAKPDYVFSAAIVNIRNLIAKINDLPKLLLENNENKEKIINLFKEREARDKIKQSSIITSDISQDSVQGQGQGQEKEKEKEKEEEEEEEKEEEEEEE